MPILKEEILRVLNEMPRNYSYPPESTKEEKKSIKQKAEKNVSDTLKRLDAFQNKARALLKEYENELKIESDKIRDENTTRFGPFQAMGSVRSKINDVIIGIEKAKRKVVSSLK